MSELTKAMSDVVDEHIQKAIEAVKALPASTLGELMDPSTIEDIVGAVLGVAADMIDKIDRPEAEPWDAWDAHHRRGFRDGWNDAVKAAASVANQYAADCERGGPASSMAEDMWGKTHGKQIETAILALGTMKAQA